MAGPPAWGAIPYIGGFDSLCFERIEEHRQECHDRGPEDEREPERCVLKPLAVVLELAADAVQRVFHAAEDGTGASGMKAGGSFVRACRLDFAA